MLFFSLKAFKSSAMQNKRKKTESLRCEEYAKYEYKKLCYSKVHETLQSLRK